MPFMWGPAAKVLPQALVPEDRCRVGWKPISCVGAHVTNDRYVIVNEYNTRYYQNTYFLALWVIFHKTNIPRCEVALINTYFELFNVAIHSASEYF